jgi:hypothetical protein
MIEGSLDLHDTAPEALCAREKVIPAEFGTQAAMGVRPVHAGINHIQNL